jgi:hypothetical protein
MTQEETHLIEVAKRYTLISTQISQAYSTEQTKLDLDQVLALSRLSSSAGAHKSLEAIKKLAALTEAHKTAMEKVFLSCTNDLGKAIATLPDDQQADYRAGLLKSLYGQLAAQSKFYENRAKWIAAAREICDLVESRRTTSRFEDETIVFAEDADRARFEALLEVVDQTHSNEAVHTKQMLDRFAESAALLGFSVQ